MNSNSRVLTLSLGVAMVAATMLSSNAVAEGAKGRDGVYGQQSASGRVVVGTLPATNRNRGRGHQRGGNRVVVVQPQLSGPRNYYFDQGTGANAPAMPSIYFNGRTNRGAKRQHRQEVRVTGNRASARRGLTEQQVRELIDQLPPRNRNATVDPSTQAAARESSGISFGPRNSSTAAALATRKRAPGITTGYRVGAPRYASAADLPKLDLGKHGSDQYVFANGTWFVPRDGRLHPALPPAGLTLNRLPNGFESVTRGGNEFFTADGVFLRRYAGGYVVVSMQPEAAN